MQVDWSPPEVPVDRPSVARMWDYMLGGYHYFEVDRVMADRIAQLYPDLPLVARANRALLRRIVHFLSDQGIDQFIDVGSGIPTASNVHEIAQARNPNARVVYVDIDPIAIAHSLAILRDNPLATAIQADFRQIKDILDLEQVRALIDYEKPFALILLALLHFIPDDDEAYGAVRAARDRMAPGSFMAIVHTSYECAPPDVLEQIQKISAGAATTRMRTRQEILRFFEGFELVEPGLTFIPLWRPDKEDALFFEHPERTLSYCGVGRKL